ncbi:hypothetical protein SMACR_08006 [Sordaria macrospora]|uniref:WGS project CABT00000000 data, contig 2.13 n=2 Tax=Sordaria macrospora TaxID=5147 RepID=F7VY60_SORMK|nr:uncharacterized protein SMAC_08006 [Sordaria macrospora k-hell]KAA8629367.1 hypothetical protein SMACR_08006 [Sordaria macrospora]WPJ62894.1 hypothetical protein SMAC4_08006 [Sordaria macrospora]CCC10454.1 unnamed protein product [Sordaria macrospora k-hell]
MSSIQQRPPLHRSDPTNALPPALSHENPDAIDIDGEQLVDQLNELVGLMNFLGENPATHIQGQAVDVAEAVADADPVPTYTPLPVEGEKTIDVSASDQHQDDQHPADQPPRYRKPRNRLQKRPPKYAH